MNKKPIIGIDMASGPDQYVIVDHANNSMKRYAYCPQTKNYELKEVRQAHARVDELNRKISKHLFVTLNRIYNE